MKKMRETHSEGSLRPILSEGVPAEVEGSYLEPDRTSESRDVTHAHARSFGCGECAFAQDRVVHALWNCHTTIKKSHANRRGVATITALVLLAVIGITIAGAMTRLSMQARRSCEETVRAQREQIEIARSMGTGVILPDELRR